MRCTTTVLVLASAPVCAEESGVAPRSERTNTLLALQRRVNFRPQDGSGAQVSVPSHRHADPGARRRRGPAAQAPGKHARCPETAWVNDPGQGVDALCTIQPNRLGHAVNIPQPLRRRRRQCSLVALNRWRLHIKPLLQGGVGGWAGCGFATVTNATSLARSPVHIGCFVSEGSRLCTTKRFSTMLLCNTCPKHDPAGSILSPPVAYFM